MIILIADDSIQIRDRLKETLHEMPEVEGVCEAGTGREALSLIRKINPDVVLLDIVMPDGNGLQVLETMKELGTSSKIVVMTNHAYPQLAKRCVRAGARYFLDKSNEFGKIPEVIQSLNDNTLMG